MKFKEFCMKHKYGDCNFEKGVYFEQFLSFKKEKFTVDEYTDRIQDLCNLYELDESPTHNLAQYIKGLRPEILEKTDHYKTI